jgi:hypothetical protein
MKTNPVPGTDHLVSAQFPALGEPFQPLLWIPEFTGNRTAFCSLNIRRHPDYSKTTEPHAAQPPDIYSLMGHDDNGCPRCAPFEAWENPNCGTAYTVISITRTLTHAELSDIGQAVADQLGKSPGHYDDTIRSLRLHRLESIAQVLAARDLLISTLNANDYHGEPTLFFTGMPVMHYTDDGQLFAGTIKGIADDLLHITWPDGEEGWEEPDTCYLG